MKEWRVIHVRGRISDGYADGEILANAVNRRLRVIQNTSGAEIVSVSFVGTNDAFIVIREKTA